MHTCIDSSVFIRGIQTSDVTIASILSLLDEGLVLSIPRLVASEVTRNLNTGEHIRLFYRIFQQTEVARIVDEPLPLHLINKYIALGLRAKGDAFIGAFAEWQNVAYLISDNRHFLRQLRTDAFQVLDPLTFLARWQRGAL